MRRWKIYRLASLGNMLVAQRYGDSRAVCCGYDLAMAFRVIRQIEKGADIERYGVIDAPPIYRGA